MNHVLNATLHPFQNVFIWVNIFHRIHGNFKDGHLRKSFFGEARIGAKRQIDYMIYPNMSIKKHRERWCFRVIEAIYFRKISTCVSHKLSLCINIVLNFLIFYCPHLMWTWLDLLCRSSYKEYFCYWTKVITWQHHLLMFHSKQ